MRRIEAVEPEHTPDLTNQVRDFWTRNVNAEKILGKSVTDHTRGDDQYFEELEQQRYRSHRHLLPWIQSMQPGKSVLEIGCGIGLDSYTMAKHGLNLTAIDLTEVGVNTARSRFEKENLNGTFQVGDAMNLQFPDNHFDYVYSFGVLHHAPDTNATIDEVFRVLKPQGEAKIMLYHRHSLNELAHRITRIPFEDKDELCPVVRRYSLKEIDELFGKFQSVSYFLDYVFGEGYGFLFRITPRWLYEMLSRRFGWHIMITAMK